MRRALLITCLFLSGLAVAAQALPPVSVPSARRAALGGSHAALADDFSTLFDNPAGFAAEKQVLNISSITLDFAGPAFTIADMAAGGLDSILAQLPDLFDANQRLYTNIDLTGPIALGYVGKGLGFGLFNRTILSMNMASVLSGHLSVSEELLLAGGYAHRFALGGGNTLDLGLMPKGYIRNEIRVEGTLTDMITLLGDISGLLTGVPYRVVTGIGFDAGIRWSMNDEIAVGLVGRDIYSPALVSTYSSFDAFRASPADSQTGPAKSELIPLDLSVGMLWAPQAAFLRDAGLDLKVLLDYNDITELWKPLGRNPILNAGMGLEATILEILSLRAGIYEALPNAGFGIDLSLFRFSFAMYGKELGMEPGSRPVFNLLIAFDFTY